MRRRELMLLLGGGMAAARALRAQQKAMPVIGFLGVSSRGPTAPYVAAFRQGLSETGYVEGQNVAIEYRWAEGQYDRLPVLAADLVGRKVDLIATSAAGARAAKDATSTIPIVALVGDPVSSGLYASLARPGGNITGVSPLTSDLTPKRFELLSELVEYRWAEGHYDRLPALAADLVGRKVDVIATSSTPGIQAAKAATSTIPIVFFGGGDFVALGLVASLARPGGNLTGISIMSPELNPKRLDLLSQLVPQASVIDLLVNPSNAIAEVTIRDVQEAARAKGVHLQILRAGTEAEIDSAFAALVQLRAGALVAASDPFFNSRREQLVALASHHAVPAIWEWREFAEAGGLISYGSSLTGMWRPVGIYVGKILKGANPADLPIQQPTKFELVINLKTAKALGLTVPQSLLAAADEVIE
jgi:putative ABC transport system substrate-binding protein